MIAILMAPVYILINLYVIRWMFRWMGACHHVFKRKGFRIAFSGLYIFLSSSVLTGFLIKKPEWLHRFLKNTGNYFLGTFVYILIVIVIADILRLICRHLLKWQWVRMQKAFIVSGTVCTILITSLSVYGILQAKNLHVTDYEVKVDKTVAGVDNLKVVLIADTHFGYSIGRWHARQMVEAINREKPDIVCIAGDFFDNDVDAIAYPDDVKESIRSIKSTYGVYACWGNHDLNEAILAGFTFGSKEKADNGDDQMGEFLKDAGVTLLNDESVLIDDKFYLVGRKDASRAKKVENGRLSPEELTAELDKSKPIIFIDHQPKELQETADAGADLDLCGHTHDGQMFPGNLTIGLFWENACGYLKKDRMHNIVTSGVGVWGPNMRVGTKSEICVIDVEFQ